MTKKYITLYIESLKLAFAKPIFVLFFLITNMSILLNTFKVPDVWLGILYPLAIVVWIAVLGGSGYVTLRLIRSGNAPLWKDIMQKGVAGFYWRMTKYVLVMFVVLGITGFLPLFILESLIPLPSLLSNLWHLITQFLFIFLLYEAIFWEDKGIRPSYRMRNIYMLDRFEWIFPLYLWIKFPHFLVSYLYYLGVDWIQTWWGTVIVLILLAVLDWVHNIFTFKVYGSDRLQVAQEMEERVKEADKLRKNKLEQKQNKKK